MVNEAFNLSLRKFLKRVGISSQEEIERVVREKDLAGKGTLTVKMVLTADGHGLEARRRRRDRSRVMPARR